MAGFKNGLQKVGDVYHFCFRIHGKQYKGSTRARDMQTAKKVLEEKRQEAILGKSLHPLEMPTVACLVKDWLNSRRSSASFKHLQSVEVVTRIWLLPSLGKQPIDQVTTGMILEARAKLLEAGRSIATANHFLRVVKLLWNHAVAAGYLEAVPFKIKTLKAQKKPRPTVPADRFQEFLTAVDSRAHTPHVPVIIRVMLGLGLRESEALGMRWEWLSDHKTYQVGRAKGKESRILPIPEWLWTALHAMPKTLSSWVFPAEDGAPHRPHYCKKVLQSVATELGMGNITQHRLRASFASLHAEGGTPLPEIKEMLGHKDISTTMIYVETTLDAKRRSQDALSQKLGLS